MRQEVRDLLDKIEEIREKALTQLEIKQELSDSIDNTAQIN